MNFKRALGTTLAVLFGLSVFGFGMIVKLDFYSRTKAIETFSFEAVKSFFRFGSLYQLR
jgi:hypothetical protein